MQEAGAFAVVLEGIPAALAEEITRTLSIPTIGIGAGVGCDGQVLVMHDLLGLFDEFRPKFVKRFGELRKPVADAVGAYAAAVRDGSFPGRSTPSDGAASHSGGDAGVDRHVGPKGCGSGWSPRWGTCTRGT